MGFCRTRKPLVSSWVSRFQRLSFFVAGFWFGISSLNAQTTRDAPSMEEILDTTTIPEGEELRQLGLQLPASLDAVPMPVEADERQEISGWVRWMILKNLPPNHEDNRKWDKRKEVVTGLHVHREGLKVETKRKRKSVKQGTWTRYKIEFIDPEKELLVEITKIDFPSSDKIAISCAVEVPLSLFGRLSQWQRDVQLYSLSATGKARVALNVDTIVSIRVNPLLFPPIVEFSPQVTAAKVELKEFEIDRISRVGGDAAEWVGKGIREILEDKLKDYDEKLVEKMNKELIKQKDKLKISVGDWVTKKVSERTKLETR